MHCDPMYVFSLFIFWGRFEKFFKVQLFSIVCVYDILFINSSINAHLYCFSLLATVNNTAVNMGV